MTTDNRRVGDRLRLTLQFSDVDDAPSTREGYPDQWAVRTTDTPEVPSFRTWINKGRGKVQPSPYIDYAVFIEYQGEGVSQQGNTFTKWRLLEYDMVGEAPPAPPTNQVPGQAPQPQPSGLDQRTIQILRQGAVKLVADYALASPGTHDDWDVYARDLLAQASQFAGAYEHYVLTGQPTLPDAEEESGEVPRWNVLEAIDLAKSTWPNQTWSLDRLLAMWGVPDDDPEAVYEIHTTLLDAMGVIRDSVSADK